MRPRKNLSNDRDYIYLPSCIITITHLSLNQSLVFGCHFTSTVLKILSVGKFNFSLVIVSGMRLIEQWVIPCDCYSEKNYTPIFSALLQFLDIFVLYQHHLDYHPWETRWCYFFQNPDTKQNKTTIKTTDSSMLLE